MGAIVMVEICLIAGEDGVRRIYTLPDTYVSYRLYHPQGIDKEVTAGVSWKAIGGSFRPADLVHGGTFFAECLVEETTLRKRRWIQEMVHILDESMGLETADRKRTR